MNPLFFADDPQFWYETQRTLGHATYGGAEIGEVALTSQRITAGDYNSWHDEWMLTTDQVIAEADVALADGHPVTARDAYLRASNYARTAEFFLHGDPEDPRIDAAYDKSVASFRHYVSLSEHRIDEVRIPFEGTVLHGYLYRSAAPGPRPTVVMHSGFDGSVEEMHFFGAAAAVERGYHVLAFDGPGQPGSRRTDGLTFRPNWESVVTPVLDWLLATHGDDVDTDRVALLGISMGGYLAPRAAAFEHRLAAVICVDGVYDLGAVATGEIPLPREQAEKALRAEESPKIDAALGELMRQNPTIRWAVAHGMYAMGVDTPRRFLASYLDYSLANGVAEQISAPTLIADAEGDLFFAGQPEELYEHITAPKQLLRFTVAEGAGAHCQSGAQRPAFGRVFDWLDTVIENQPA